MSGQNDWNTQIINEFRENDGKVGGPFEGAPLLILHCTGAKSGKTYEIPLMYQQVGDEIAIFASKAGAPTNPDWYHNLKETPEVTVELGTGSVQATAREAEGEEREQIWTKQKQDYPNFAEYEELTDRTIPVIVLEPTG